MEPVGRRWGTRGRRPPHAPEGSGRRKIRAYIDGWNDRAHPFTWTKTADHILTKANRKKTSRAEH